MTGDLHKTWIPNHSTVFVVLIPKHFTENTVFYWTQCLQMLMTVKNDASSKASIFLNTPIPTILMNNASSNTYSFPSFFMVYFMMSELQTLKTAWPGGRSVNDDLERICKQEMVHISVVTESVQENRENSQSVRSELRPRFEPGTFRRQIHSYIDILCNLRFPLTLKDRLLHPHKTTGNINVHYIFKRQKSTTTNRLHRQWSVDIQCTVINLFMSRFSFLSVGMEVMEPDLRKCSQMSSPINFPLA
jgi:hypothetical protein